MSKSKCRAMVKFVEESLTKSEKLKILIDILDLQIIICLNSFKSNLEIFL